MARYVIITSHDMPPVPTRNMDWCAYLDGQEEDGPYGYGPTELEAIAELVDNMLVRAS